MKTTWLMVVAICLLACMAVMVPASANDAGEIVLDRLVNTPECPASCEACGCCGGECRLGDLLVFGLPLLCLGAFRMVNK